MGTALGSKILALLENPQFFVHHFTLTTFVQGGKTIVGGLLGGLIRVEFTKKLIGRTKSTGDDFVLPLIVGMCIGRVGCFLAGLPDDTYGTPTNWITGVNFGDGVYRHPTQLYEIAFLLCLLGLLYWMKSVERHRANNKLPEGAYFKIFMFSYLLFRLCIEFIKPTPHIYGGLSNIRLACIAGLIYYIPHMWRLTNIFPKWRLETEHAK